MPLRGLRVLEWSSDIDGVAAPFASRLLADAGAEVVKIESPEGDSARRAGPFPDDQPDPERSGLFAYLNRGKRSIVLDLDTDQGRGRLSQLCTVADGLIHDQPALAGSLLGMSADELRAANPRLVVTSVTPFGERGPRARERADDLIVVCAANLAHATPGIPDYASDLEDEPPLRPDTPLGEFIGGLMGAIGTMFAVLNRERTGQGDAVEVSKQEALTCMLNWDLAMWSYGGFVLGRQPTRILQSPNHYLPTADGWAVIVAFIDAHWRQFVDLMGNPDWASDPRFATGYGRGEHWHELEALLISWLIEQPGLELLDKAQGRGIPCAPALTMAQAVDNEHVAARQFLVPSGLPGDSQGKLPGQLYVANGQRRPAITAYPRLGADTERVLEEWGNGPHPGVPSGSPSPAPRGEGEQILPSPVATGEGPGGRAYPAPSRPLAGIRVVDFGQIVAMPLAAQWLAFMGAEVILVESRQRLPSRSFAPYAGEPSPNTCGIFNHINRNKKSCTINLNTPEGAALAKRLAATADIVTENFSPGTMDKLGLGYEALRVLKPDLIMLSLSACGSTGPWRNFSALHSGIILLSGLASVTGYEDGHPRIVGSILPDPLAAAFCVLGITQALYHRQRTGEGQLIEVAMTETLQSVMPQAILEYTMLGREPRRIGNRHRQKAPHGIYRTAGEDRWLAVSVGSDAEWQAFCQTLGQPHAANVPDFATLEARLANADALDKLIGSWLRLLDAQATAGRLQRSGVPATMVYNARDVLTDPHLTERGFIVQDAHPAAGTRPMPGSPWSFQALPPVEYRHAPLLGEDNPYVFGDVLKLDPAEVQRLEDAKVIY